MEPLDSWGFVVFWNVDRVLCQRDVNGIRWPPTTRLNIVRYRTTRWTACRGPVDVTRTRVSQIVQQPDFPAGIELRMGKVWWAEDITAWATTKGRALRKIPATWPVAPEGGVKGAPLTSGRYKH